MSAEWLAVSGAAAALFTALGALLKVTYDKPKAVADAEAQRLANAAYPVASLQALCATLQQRMGHLEDELSAVQSNYRSTQEALDAAMDRIGILAQENREWSEYHSDITEYQRGVAGRMRTAGMDVPEPPVPPRPRTEFTRRSDFKFPTRTEFDDASRRRGDTE